MIAWPTTARLAEMVQTTSQTRVAAKLGVARKTLQRRLILTGIVPRSSPDPIDWPDDERLAEMVRTMTYVEIAAELGCTKVTIWQRLSSRGMIGLSQTGGRKRGRRPKASSTHHERVTDEYSDPALRWLKVPMVGGPDHGYWCARAAD